MLAEKITSAIREIESLFYVVLENPTTSNNATYDDKQIHG